MNLKLFALGIVITALFGTSIVITVGYISQYISLIGYSSQLVPLFSGLVVGVLLFTILGSTISLKLNYGMVYGIVISLALFITVFEVISIENYVIAGGILVALSIMISSGFMPVSTFVVDNTLPSMGFRRRTLFAVLSGMVSLVAIMLVALIYELSGQDTMTTEITLVAVLTVVVLLVLYSQAGKRKSPSGN